MLPSKQKGPGNPRPSLAHHMRSGTGLLIPSSHPTGRTAHGQEAPKTRRARRLRPVLALASEEEREGDISRNRTLAREAWMYKRQVSSRKPMPIRLSTNSVAVAGTSGNYGWAWLPCMSPQ